MFTFEPFPKIARLKREQIITEKLDGTNAQVAIYELDSDEKFAYCYNDPYCLGIQQGAENGDSALAIYAGSRKRWIAPEGTIQDNAGDSTKGTDNFAFAHFVADNATELFKLGPGQHFGEWYGKGIQRGYGLEEKRFALFNVARWGDHNPNTPDCCHVVPNLTALSKGDPDKAMELIHRCSMVQQYHDPEGIIVYHTASRTLYKQTFEMDGGKWNS